MQGDFEAALALALKKLRASDRFVSEVRSVLADYSPEVVDQVVTYLTERRMLSDVRAAEGVVRKRSAYGSLRLREDLERRGAPEELIEASLPSDAQERAQLWQALTKKFSPDEDATKAARFLYSRGFREEDIESAIEKYFVGRTPNSEWSEVPS